MIRAKQSFVMEKADLKKIFLRPRGGLPTMVSQEGFLKPTTKLSLYTHERILEETNRGWRENEVELSLFTFRRSNLKYTAVWQ